MHKIEQANLARLTTMRIGGDARCIFFPESADELISLIYDLKSQKIPWTILGAGSNTLASSNGAQGAVICMTSMNWIERVGPDCIEAGPGVRMPKLAGACAQMGLSGCEFYEGIPGSLGGGIIMNAGAHGTWTSNILEKISLFDTQALEIKNFAPGQIDFSYRHSNIDPKRYVVIGARYRLRQGQTTAHILDVMKEYSAHRNRTQPKGHSSGCIFRNPGAEAFAGKMIDEMGLKGTRHGGAEISPIHGNFIVNAHGATSQQVCALMHYAQLRAWRTYKVWLRPEVQPLGDYHEANKILWLPLEKRPANWEEISESAVGQIAV